MSDIDPTAGWSIWFMGFVFISVFWKFFTPTALLMAAIGFTYRKNRIGKILIILAATLMITLITGCYTITDGFRNIDNFLTLP